MSKKEKQLQQPKEELTADELKGVNGAEGIFQTSPPASEQEQLNAELAQEGGMMGGIWTINSDAGFIWCQHTEYLFHFLGGHKKWGGSTLALLFFYACSSVVRNDATTLF